MNRMECRRIVEKIVKRVIRHEERKELKYGLDKCRILPITVSEVYIFGSYLKGKEQPNDVDIIIIHYKMNGYEEEYFWRSDEQGYFSIDTAVKKLTRGIPKENINVLVGTSIEECRIIHPDPNGGYVKIDRIEKVWDEHMMFEDSVGVLDGLEGE